MPVNNDMPPLSQGANLQQPGTYTVKIISVNAGTQVLVNNETSEQLVTLVGIFTVDPAQPGCENQSNDRLVLLTANPAATYTLTVIKPDPNDPAIVIGKIVRHDTIDLGLDLVASGLPKPKSSGVGMNLVNSVTHLSVPNKRSTQVRTTITRIPCTIRTGDC
jgi:endonuclease YncB( thermonuclease family)